MINWLRRFFRREGEPYKVFLAISNNRELFLGTVRALGEDDLYDKAGSMIVNYLWSAGVFSGGMPVRINYRWERSR